MKQVQIYIDGSCLGNPGPGGWAAVLVYGRHKKAVIGKDIETTNQRMELTAAIQALEILKEPVQAELFTNSQYVINVINNCKIRKNHDLVNKLRQLCQNHKITTRRVKKVHGGISLNERTHALSNSMANSAREYIEKQTNTLTQKAAHQA